MKSLSVNNPIILFPSSSLEKMEYRESKRSNILAKINLHRIRKKLDHGKNVIITDNFMRVF